MGRARLRIAISCIVVALCAAVGLWLMLVKTGDAPRNATASRLDRHRSHSPIPDASAPDSQSNDNTAASASPPMHWDESMCDAALGATETGIGWLTKDVRLTLEQRKAESEFKKIMESAAESSVPLERAVALHLQAKTKAGETRNLLLKQYSNCKSGEPCRKEFEAAVTAAPLPERDAIAQLAIALPDPQLYALAYRTCKQQQQGFCQAISAAQWAQRDPTNGTAWLYAAGEAKAAQQNQAYEEALYKLSISTHFESGNAAIGAAMDTLSTLAESQLTRMQLFWQTAGSSGQLSNYALVTDHCNGHALQNPNRQQICDRIANTLLLSGESFFDRAVGIGIGSNLHWSPERMATLRDEQDAMRELKLAGLPSEETSISGAISQCRFMMRQATIRSRDLRLGEVRSLKAQIAEQPESVAALAQRYRDRGKAAAPATP